MTRAGGDERARLNRTFAALCAIPSPFGQEAACAEHVAGELRALGLEVDEDDAGQTTGAQCGNLLARLPGQSPRSLLLCAHLDTVVPQAPIEPQVVDGGWVNAHEGILGADNKAAVAVMLEVARRCAARSRAPVGLELLFTVSEENALVGAKAFDARPAAVGLRLRVRPRHARSARSCRPRPPTTASRPSSTGSPPTPASAPSRGAARSRPPPRAVAAMPIGRVDAQTTVNVGQHRGRQRVHQRRARALPGGGRDALAGRRTPSRRWWRRSSTTCNDGANAAECDVDVIVEQKFHGYRTRASAPGDRGRPAGADGLRLRADA